jgi:hypothetical protein
MLRPRFFSGSGLCLIETIMENGINLRDYKCGTDNLSWLADPPCPATAP